jgi:hypothetical protein
VVDAAAPASVPQQAKADRSTQWALAQVLPSSRRSLEGVHSNCHRNTKFGTLHAPHTWQHVFAATHAIFGPTPLPSLHHTDDGVCCRCSSPLQEAIFNLPGLSGNWEASPGIPVKTCDKKERNKNKCTSDAADEQHGPKDYAGHVGAERNGSSSRCEQCHAIRGKVMPYLDNWPTECCAKNNSKSVEISLSRRCNLGL